MWLVSVPTVPNPCLGLFERGSCRCNNVQHIAYVCVCETDSVCETDLRYSAWWGLPFLSKQGVNSV